MNIKQITVEWAEGDGSLDGKSFDSIEALERQIFKNPAPTLGYDKHKLRIELVDGDQFVYRYDYGDKDSDGRLLTLRKDLNNYLQYLNANGGN